MSYRAKAIDVSMYPKTEDESMQYKLTVRFGSVNLFQWLRVKVKVKVG